MKVNDEFDDFDSFQAAVEQLSHESKTKFVIRDGKTINQANKLLKIGSRHYQEKLKYARVRLECRHGSTHRSRSMGFRPNQKTMKLGCPVAIVVSADRNKEKLIVRELILEHNHDSTQDNMVLKKGVELDQSVVKLEQNGSHPTNSVEWSGDQAGDQSMAEEVTASISEPMTVEDRVKDIVINLESVTRILELEASLRAGPLVIGWFLSTRHKLSLTDWSSMIKLMDFVNNGCQVIVIHNDADADTELSELKNTDVQTFNEDVINASLRFLGCRSINVQFVEASSLQQDPLFNRDLQRLVSRVSLKDAKMIVDGQESTLQDVFTHARLALCEEYLQVSAMFGGPEHKRSFDLAETYLPTLNYQARPHLHALHNIDVPVPEGLWLNFDDSKQDLTQKLNVLTEETQAQIGLAVARNIIYPHLGVKDTAFEVKKFSEESLYVFPNYEDLEAATQTQLISTDELIQTVIMYSCMIGAGVIDEIQNPSEMTVVMEITQTKEEPEETSQEPGDLSADQLKVTNLATLSDNSCTLCQEDFQTHEDYKKHLLDKHDALQQASSTDNQITPRRRGRPTKGTQRTSADDDDDDDEDDVVKSCKDDQATICDVCGKMMSDFQSLRTHYRSHSETRPFQCKFCTKSFTTKSQCKIHEERHGAPKPFMCTVCHKYFSSSQSLKTHGYQHSGVRPYNCGQCGKGFLTRAQVKTHEKKHQTGGDDSPPRPSGKRPIRAQLEHLRKHTCDECPKKFATEAALRFHLKRSHNIIVPANNKRATAVRQFSCQFCDKVYDRRQHRDEHERIHTGARPFLCSMCDRGFTTKAALLRHERTHTGEKPFSCGVCGKRFIDRRMVQVHMRSHTGERPYPCTHCGKRFTQKNALDEHERIHTGERPYKCKYCGKGFTHRSHVPLHERMHTGERPFACRFCHVNFNRKENCMKHIRRHPEYTDDLGPVHMFMLEGQTVKDDDGQAHEEVTTTEPFIFMCSVCNMKFPDRESCAQHLSVHTVHLEQVLKVEPDQYEYSMEVTTEEVGCLQSLVEDSDQVLTLVISDDVGAQETV